MYNLYFGSKIIDCQMKSELSIFLKPMQTSHFVYMIYNICFIACPGQAVPPLKPVWFRIIISNRSRKIVYNALTTTHKWLTAEVFSWPNHQFTSSFSRKIISFIVIVAARTKTYAIYATYYMNQVSECDFPSWAMTHGLTTNWVS